MALYFYDDARARTFEPFALTRPACELRAGAVLLRHRWESALGERGAGLLVAPHLEYFEELDAPPAMHGDLHVGDVIVNSRCVLALGPIPRDVESWTCEGKVAAVRLARPAARHLLESGELELEGLAGAGGESAEVKGRWLSEVWDLIAQLGPQLAEDIAAVGPRIQTVKPEYAVVLGPHAVFVEQGAEIEPHVVFDVTAGPVLVLHGAHVYSHTRLIGPVAIAGGATVLGDRIATCSIGDVCKVRGEVSNTIFLGHANKGHDGFVGHSYLGRWVNLGAGTTTSNLKNTYGQVQLWTPEGVRDTGQQFLGTFFGDHAKTGIGMRLTTGCVIGAGAQVYDKMPPKYVPPFAWGGGEPYGVFDLDKFLEVAERVMSRRHIHLTERARRQLLAAYGRHHEHEGPTS
ncbi:MAG: putative sugar nucleotidyl transferase [Gemmatimonadaceae bacterium]